jgi:hypothetical protein
MGNDSNRDGIWSGSSVMKSKDWDTILEQLGVMVKTELMIAKFYRTCARIWGKDKAFWLGLEGDENLHADNIRKMARIVIEKFELFEAYRPFNPVAMKTIISGIENNIQRLDSGEITEDNVFFIVRDIERSLIESKYDELVKTNDVEYQTLVKKIVSQTLGHHHKIEKKIEVIEREKNGLIAGAATSF